MRSETRTLAAVFVLTVTMTVTAAAARDLPRADSFRLVGHFLVPDGGSAEIVSAGPDGRILVYTSAQSRRVGVVDLENPARPRLVVEVEIDGEPTSVAVTPDGDVALVAVKTSEFTEGMPPAPTPGRLLFLRLPDGAVAGSVMLGIGPDSVAIVEVAGQTVAVVAIENEPILVDEAGGWVEGDAPGQPNDVSPKGLVQVVTVRWDAIESSTVADVTFDDDAALAMLGLPFPADPQPEYVAIHGLRAAVTPYEKVEGLAVTRSRQLWAVLDNDGGQVESRLVRLGRLPLGNDEDSEDADKDDSK